MSKTLVAAGFLMAGTAMLTACSGSTKTVAGPTTTATVTTTEASTVTATPTKVIATHEVTATITYTPPVVTAFSDGTYRVGTEVKPGTYHTTPGGSGCYYERDNNAPAPDNIIANDNITGPTTIDIAPSDYAFKTNGGCNWVKVG